jgi:hypothetical protein
VNIGSEISCLIAALCFAIIEIILHVTSRLVSFDILVYIRLFVGALTVLFLALVLHLREPSFFVWIRWHFFVKARDLLARSATFLLTIVFLSLSFVYAPSPLVAYAGFILHPLWLIVYSEWPNWCNGKWAPSIQPLIALTLTIVGVAIFLSTKPAVPTPMYTTYIVPSVPVALIFAIFASVFFAITNRLSQAITEEKDFKQKREIKRIVYFDRPVPGDEKYVVPNAMHVTVYSYVLAALIAQLLFPLFYSVISEFEPQAFPIRKIYNDRFQFWTNPLEGLLESPAMLYTLLGCLGIGGVLANYVLSRAFAFAGAHKAASGKDISAHVSAFELFTVPFGAILLAQLGLDGSAFQIGPMIGLLIMAIGGAWLVFSGENLS